MGFFFSGRRAQVLDSEKDPVSSGDFKKDGVDSGNFFFILHLVLILDLKIQMYILKNYDN